MFVSLLTTVPNEPKIARVRRRSSPVDNRVIMQHHPAFAHGDEGFHPFGMVDPVVQHQRLLLHGSSDHREWVKTLVSGSESRLSAKNTFFSGQKFGGPRLNIFPFLQGKARVKGQWVRLSGLGWSFGQFRPTPGSRDRAARTSRRSDDQDVHKK